MDEINSLYTKKENIARIKQMFIQNGSFPSIQLHDFFSNGFYSLLQKELARLRFKRSNKPTLHSYSEASAPRTLTAALHSEEFLSFVSGVLGKKVKKMTAVVRCFTWKDYSIINDKYLEKPGIDVIFDASKNWKKDYGGSVVYVDGSGDYSRMPPKQNTLLIAERTKNVQKFVQYVNHNAKNKKRYLIFCKL